MGDDARIIDPTDPKFKHDDAVLLRQMLEHSFKEESARVWHTRDKDGLRVYSFFVSDRGLSTPKKLVLTQDIIHQQHFNLVNGEVENRYAIYPADTISANGAFGKVHNVLGELIPDHNDGLVFKPKSRIVKIQTYKDDARKADIIHESNISHMASHLHVAPVTFNDKEKASYITMSRFFSQELSKVLKSETPIDFKARLQLSCQLIEALKTQFHYKRIIHRDIKPTNIIVGDDHVNIVDMGFSKKSDEISHDRCGTLGYAAPEVYFCSYSFKSDVYALGMILGLLWGGNFDKDVENEIANGNASYKSLPVIINHFKKITDSENMPPVIRDKIKIIIDRMTAYNVNSRPDISEAALLFDEILLSLRSCDVPNEFQQSFIDSHKCAFTLRDKIQLEIGSFEDVYFDMKSKLESVRGGIYSFREKILAGTTSFESICEEMRAAIKSISENAYSVREFKKTLGVKSFTDELSKNEIVAIIDYTAKDYREMMTRIESLILQAELTTNALTVGSIQYPSYVKDVKLLNYTLKKFWYKLIKHRKDFDKVQQILAAAKLEVTKIESLLESITSFIADERANAPFLRKRFAAIDLCLSPLDSIKNKIRSNMKDYLEASGLLTSSSNSLTVFRQVSPKQRFRDINDILDVIDYAVDENQLRKLLKIKLDNLPTGFAGRSELRKAIKNSINLDLAISRSVTSSPVIRTR